jgi:hypothetical protein
MTSADGTTSAAAVVRPRPAAREGDRPAVVAVGLSFVCLPLVRFGAAGSATLADAAIALAIVAAFLWLADAGRAIRLPYAVSVGVMVAAGALAGIVGGHPLVSAQALAEDLVLFVWCVAIVNVCRTPSALGATLAAWAWSATAWAAVLVVAAAAGTAAVAGQEAAAGRASLTFLNPNQAGAYFAISLMVLLAAPVPRRRATKVVAVVLVATATVLTSSNAALGGVLAGLLVAKVIAVGLRHGLVAAAALAIAATVTVGALASAYVALDVAAAAKESDVRIVHNTLGRSERSAEDRLFRFAELRELFLDGGVLGHGPAATKPALADMGRPVPKSAHNDLFATLVERGVAGVAGLALLFGALTRASASIARGGLRPAFAPAVAAPRFLVGGLAVVAVGSLSHEILHFRHVWALFAIVAAVSLWAVAPSSPRASVAAAREEAVDA